MVSGCRAPAGGDQIRRRVPALTAAIVLEAERGQFHGISDCLLTVGGGSEPVSGVTVRGSPGAVLRMHREDYANAALYTKAEVG